MEKILNEKRMKVEPWCVSTHQVVKEEPENDTLLQLHGKGEDQYEISSRDAEWVDAVYIPNQPNFQSSMNLTSTIAFSVQGVIFVIWTQKAYSLQSSLGI